MRGAAMAALGIMLASATLTGDEHAPIEAVRLRPMQPIARKLVEDGLKRSATIRQLAERLRASDLIVYVEVRSDMPSQTVGSLRFIAPSASDRFLRIALNRQYDWTTLIALLGHELQHVSEVADAPDVRSGEDLRRLYQRVGIRVGRDAYDSLEAQMTGRLVRAELRGNTSTLVGGRRVSLDSLLLGSGSIAAAAP
jgi:hypothetical protein